MIESMKVFVIFLDLDIQLLLLWPVCDQCLILQTAPHHIIAK